MTDSNEGLLPDGAHWRFALDVYARPGVSAACLELQARHDVDVNVLLVALFAALKEKRRMGAAEIATLDAAVAEQRRRLVLPLREIRTMLKPLPFGPGTQSLRNIVKKAELSAEQFEQFCLAREAAALPPGEAADAEAVCCHVIRHFDPAAGADFPGETSGNVAVIAGAAEQVA